MQVFLLTPLLHSKYVNKNIKNILLNFHNILNHILSQPKYIFEQRKGS
jgi:hypothetical protein